MLDNVTFAYALILLGMVLLVAELFLPTGGILTVLSIGALIVGVTITYNYDPSTGVVTLIVLLILMPVLIWAGFRYWPHTGIGKKLILGGPAEDDTVANMPVNLELEQLRGRFGKATSWLRPSGVAEFDGRRVDVLSEGSVIEPGRWVRCIDVKSGKVVVREADGPPDLGELDPSQLT